MSEHEITVAQEVAWKAADEAYEAWLGRIFDEEQWRAAFDAKMRELGWEYSGDHCMCDSPDYGHEPACGWSKTQKEKRNEK